MYEKTTSAGEGVQAPARAGILTNSRLACFRSCPRKHYLRYELGLTPVKDDLPRKFGTALHALFEAADKGIDMGDAAAALGIDDPYVWEMLTACYDGHLRQHFEDEKWCEPVVAEIEFDAALVNPETGKPTPVWRLGGKIDRIIKLRDGRLALMEYKTTSRDFAPGADYWNALHMDQQLSLYVIAARELGYPVETVVYDVTRRPALRPSQIPVIEDGARVVIDQNGDRVRTKDGKKWRETADTAAGYVAVTRSETPEEFGARVRADIEARPHHYFARIEIARLDQDLDDCRSEVWQQQLAIREAQRSRRWYRNPGACYSATGSTCDYLPICLNRELESLTPDGYVRSANVHPELAGSNN